MYFVEILLYSVLFLCLIPFCLFSTVVIFFCEYSVAREGLLYAKRSGMTNGSYVFIVVHLEALVLHGSLQKSWKWSISRFTPPETRKEVKEAFKHMLVLGFNPGRSENIKRYEEYTISLKKAGSGPPFNIDKYTDKKFRTKVIHI